MTSKIIIPKENKMNTAVGIRAMLGVKVEKEAEFMGKPLKIAKLTYAQVKKIQDASKTSGDAEDGFGVMRLVIRLSAEGGESLTDEDFDNFAIDDLAKLSQEIMAYSGMSQGEGKLN